jgi:RNA 2',3'-cyclic 3'-phosphodiesterase
LSLFFALWPPRETALALGHWALEVQQQTGGRATADDKIHLTLAFIGNVQPERAIKAARRVDNPSFHLPIEISKYWKHSQIVWAGPTQTPPALTSLVDSLTMQLYREEYILERRPFAAHITLVRKANAPASLPSPPQVSWPTLEFVLVRSTPTGHGSRYEVLERFALKSA